MKIKSSSRFSDELTISSGVKSMTLTVDLDLTCAAQALRKAREELAEAQDLALKDPACMPRYGLALRSFIAVVFGPVQTEQLLAFYEGQPASLIEDVMPYIFRRIVPLTVSASARRAKELRSTARKNARKRH